MSALLPALLSEMRANLRLALPIIATQLSFVSMGMVDTVFAGRLGAAELAAVAVGSNAWFMLFVVFLGLSMSVSPLVANRIGAGQGADPIGSFLRGAMSLAFVLGLAWWAVARLAIEPILALVGLDGTTTGMAQDYLYALSWSALPLSLCLFLRNGAEGHGLAHVALVAGLVGLAVNALFDWLLMYGRWGFPALGPEGCGWATGIAAWVMVGIYAWQYATLPPLRALRLTHRDRAGLRPAVGEILRFGGPVAAMLVAEAWLFCGGSLLMARFGVEAVAAHQIAINWASACFMVPTAIGMATAVRVGLAYGAGDRYASALRGRAGISLALAFAGLSASIMILAPGRIVALFTDVPSLAGPAARFLLFAALFQAFDCVQASANGALRGLKDSTVPMFITTAAYWVVGMPLAYGLAVRGGAGADGIWYGFIAGLMVAALGLGSRFLFVRAPLRGVQPAG